MPLTSLLRQRLIILAIIWGVPLVALLLFWCVASTRRTIHNFRSRCPHGLRRSSRCQPCEYAAREVIVELRRLAAEAEDERRRTAVLEAERQQQELNLRKADFLGRARKLGFLHEIEPEHFQRFVWVLCRARGFEVTETPLGRDGGVDGFLKRGNDRIVLQCKRYKSDVGEPWVRDLYGAAMHHGASGAWLVTTGSFSVPARRFAEGKPITLIDGERLLDLIEETSLAPGMIPDDFVLRPGEFPRVFLDQKGNLLMCPQCGARLLQRRGKRGLFYGCMRYPECRYTRSIRR